jgi:hypothetical protein
VTGLSRCFDRVSRTVHRPFNRRPWTFEVFLFALAVIIYQVSRALVIGDTSTALRHAYEIVRWERSSGLFVEIDIQQLVLGHLNVAKALNYFYFWGHYTITPLFFIWLYRRRHRAYPFIRNAFFLANAIALSIFVAFPVAPPRLLNGQGFVDTLEKVSDINLHGGRLAGWFNPYAAVPSMHFGYALMIGVAGCVLAHRWPLRLLPLAYPLLVFVAITATANHYVLDSIAGSLVVAAGFVAVAVWVRMRARVSPRPVLPMRVVRRG